jgi:hypothetical protein
VADKVAGFPADFPGLRSFAVDLQEVEEIGELLGITALPTFVLLRGGAEAARLAGVPQQRPARALAQAVRQHLQAGGGGGGGSGSSPAVGLEGPRQRGQGGATQRGEHKAR